MQIICPACTKRLQIADDKLPTDRQVRLTCPACQERFTFDPQAGDTLAETSADTIPRPVAAPAAPQAAHTPSATLSTNIDITDVGPAPRALLCLDSATHREACQGMLPSLGYNTVHVLSYQAEALAYLSQVPYECCLLDATFDGSTLQANPVFACLQALPMERRRYMFTALCLPNVVTADAMTAYSHSVNLIINPSDLPSCRRILEQHLAAHKRLYRVYRELRQQLGKDI
jgi:CheY-like chemotaxis protein